MAGFRAQVILHTTDNIPENFVTNSFAFSSSDIFPDIAAIVNAFRTFYQGIGAANLSVALAQNGHEVKFYDLPGPVPNYPISEQTWNMTAAPSGSALPAEVALCLSFQGARTPGFPQARRRGRVYIGPLALVTNTAGRPTAAFITAMTAAATTFKATITALPSDTQWAVWSGVDVAAVPVANGWVDNAFDTQRRRGVIPTTKTTFS